MFAASYSSFPLPCRHLPGQQQSPQRVQCTTAPCKVFCMPSPSPARSCLPRQYRVCSCSQPGLSGRSAAPQKLVWDEACPRHSSIFWGLPSQLSPSGKLVRCARALFLTLRGLAVLVTRCHSSGLGTDRALRLVPKHQPARLSRVLSDPRIWLPGDILGN